MEKRSGGGRIEEDLISDRLFRKKKIGHKINKSKYLKKGKLLWPAYPSPILLGNGAVNPISLIN